MTCHCGCNQPVKRNFLPGHDQNLRSQLERKVGGLLNLADLLTQIEALLNNELTSAQFAHAARALFDQAKKSR